MLNQIKLENILFLDIETVPQVPIYGELSERLQQLWDKKMTRIAEREEQTAEELYPRAGIYAEFGKIVCVSLGFITTVDNEKQLRVKSFADDDEKKLLTDLAFLLQQSFSKNHHFLCAHNGKEFDYPYIARRMLLNNILLPKILQIAGKKPWEIRHLDTMELWKFGDYKHYTSLDLLAAIFNIPSPKDDIDGSMVAKVYWEDNDLERIVKYCQRDVLTVVQLYLRYKGDPLIKHKNVKLAK